MHYISTEDRALLLELHKKINSFPLEMRRRNFFLAICKFACDKLVGAMSTRTLEAEEVRNLILAVGEGPTVYQKAYNLADRLEISRRSMIAYKLTGTKKGAANVLLKQLAIEHGVISPDASEDAHGV